MQRIFYWTALIAAFTLTTAQMVSEEIDEDRFSIEFGGGSLGKGIDMGYKVNEQFSLRANTNFGSFTMPGILGLATAGNGTLYDYQADMSATGLLANYDTGGVMFTAGVYYNNNDILISSTPLIGLNIGGTNYTASEIGVLYADTDFNNFAPYLGMGVDRPLFRFFPKLPFTYYARLGVLFQGSPNLTMTASAGGVAEADLALEAREFDEALTILEYYPVFTTGLSLKF